MNVRLFEFPPAWMRKIFSDNIKGSKPPDPPRTGILGRGGEGVGAPLAPAPQHDYLIGVDPAARFRADDFYFRSLEPFQRLNLWTSPLPRYHGRPKCPSCSSRAAARLKPKGLRPRPFACTLCGQVFYFSIAKSKSIPLNRTPDEIEEVESLVNRREAEREPARGDFLGRR